MPVDLLPLNNLLVPEQDQQHPQQQDSRIISLQAASHFFYAAERLPILIG